MQKNLLRNILLRTIPLPEKARQFKRKLCPCSLSFNNALLEQGIKQLQMLSSIGFSIEGKTILEIGTGWQPIIPVIFYLKGCRNLILIDIHKYLDNSLFLEAINGFTCKSNQISEKLNIPFAEIQKKLNVDLNGSLQSNLDSLKMRYIAPCNIIKSTIADNSIDVIISHGVLEHIPPKILGKMFVKFKQILKKDGKMCHIIYHEDHLSHSDKNKSRLNFLKFNDTVYKLISSIYSADYQNRLRHYEYIELLKGSGFPIVYDRPEIDLQAMNDLKNQKICEKYRHVSHEKLAITKSNIVVSKS